jgi:copper chaperone NosL
MFTANEEMGVAASLHGRPNRRPERVPTEGHTYVFCAAVFVLLFLGCQTNKVEPVALLPEDTCAHCKMAISEKRYAAELIDSEGQAFKFDDITCMAKFIKSNKNTNKAVAHFVMDFDERQWVKAEDAVYVHSSELSTPMNGGIIAFRNQTKAQEANAKYHGKPLSFKEVFTP